MKLIVVLVCVTTCKVSAVTKTYNAYCPSGSTVRVDAPAIGVMSKFKDYKELVCVACSVVNCKGTRLFGDYRKNNDGDRIKSTSNLEDLSLKTYGSDDIDVSYRCPGGKPLQTARCETSYTMKQCLTAQCGEWKTSHCEVYVGSTKVSSGKVAVSRGVYQVEQTSTKTEKMKQTLEKIKKIVTSDKAKGIASVAGAAVLANKEQILKLAKVIGVPDKNTKNIEQIIRLGNTFYTKDFDGGLTALAELTGRALSEEEEQLIEEDMGEGEIDYTKLLAVLESEREDIMRGEDLYEDEQKRITFMDEYGLYILIGVAIVFAIGFMSCVACCCCLCMRKKRNGKGTVYHPTAREVTEMHSLNV